MKNLLEDHIKWAIYNYPTLSRDKDYESSRFHVLNHLFLVIGNGYEWGKDGTLHSIDGNKTRKTLPKGYFEKKIWQLAIPKDAKKEFKKKVPKGRICLIHTGVYGNWSVYFEGTEEEAITLQKEFGSKEKILEYLQAKHEHVDEARIGGCFGKPTECKPYPICGYSAMAEILDGHTHEPGREGFDFTPQQDWLEGCKDIVKYAWGFYNDDERCKRATYHPTDGIWNSMRYDYQKAVQENNLEGFCKFLGNFTLDEHIQNIWEKHKAEQLDYLKRFIEKFEVRL